jgi:hypothetical protein
VSLIARTLPPIEPRATAAAFFARFFFRRAFPLSTPSAAAAVLVAEGGMAVAVGLGAPSIAAMLGVEMAARSSSWTRIFGHLFPYFWAAPV